MQTIVSARLTESGGGGGGGGGGPVVTAASGHGAVQMSAFIGRIRGSAGIPPEGGHAELSPCSIPKSFRRILSDEEGGTGRERTPPLVLQERSRAGRRSRALRRRSCRMHKQQ